MSDTLSQDQINALLSQSGLDGTSTADILSEGGGGEGEAADYGALGRGLDMYRDQAAKVLSSLLNKQIGFTTTSEAGPASLDQIEAAFSEPSLVVEIPFEQGVAGIMRVLLTKKAVATLSDLMMMGDGSAAYAEEHKDAIGEIFNQVQGAFNNVFGSTIGDQVSSGSITVRDFSLPDPSLSIDQCDSALFNLTLESGVGYSVAVLLESELSRQFMARLGITASSESGQSQGSIGLNRAELDDLSNVTMNLDLGGSSSNSAFHEPAFSGPAAPQGNVNMLLDVELDVSIELGSTNLSIKKVLELAPGSIVELNRMAGEPVDLLVNNKVVAKGEVVVVDENFGIRIVSLVSPEERIKSLR